MRYAGKGEIDRAILRAARLRPEAIASVLAWAAVQSPEWLRRELGIELDDAERAELLALAVELRRGAPPPARP